MKQCFNCRIEKDESEFPSVKGKLIGKCRSCKRAYDNKYWALKGAKLSPTKNKNKNARITRNCELVANHLKNNPCVDCGESRIVVLEFDHIKDKTGAVSQLVVDGVSLPILQAEIDKCEIRCANCHRMKTALERGFRILSFV